MDKFLKSLQQQLDADVAPHVVSNFEEIARRVPTDISTARKRRVTPLKAFSAAAAVAISTVVLAAGSSAPTPRTDFDTPLQVRWDDFDVSGNFDSPVTNLEGVLGRSNDSPVAAVNCMLSPTLFSAAAIVNLSTQPEAALIENLCYQETVELLRDVAPLPEPTELVICVAEWDHNLFVFPVGPNTVSADQVCQQNAMHPASFNKSSELRPVLPLENEPTAMWWFYRVAPKMVTNYEGYPVVESSWQERLRRVGPAPEVVRDFIRELLD